MIFRTRLSVLSLESRENPSGPDLLNPISTTGDLTPPPPTTTTDPVQTAINAAVAGATTTTTTTDPLVTDNSVLKTPIVVVP